MSKVTIRRLLFLLLFLAIAFVFHAKEMFGQEVGVSLGAYGRGAGGHPAYFLDLQARATYHGVGVEFEHVPTVNTVSGFPVDLFSLSIATDISPHGAIVLPLRVGWSRWRDWQNPQKEFIFHDGVRLQAGVGLRLRPARVELRATWTEYGGLDPALLIGLELRL